MQQHCSSWPKAFLAGEALLKGMDMMKQTCLEDQIHCD